MAKRHLAASRTAGMPGLQLVPVLAVVLRWDGYWPSDRASPAPDRRMDAHRRRCAVKLLARWADSGARLMPPAPCAETVRGAVK